MNLIFDKEKPIPSYLSLIYFSAKEDFSWSRESLVTGIDYRCHRSATWNYYQEKTMLFPCTLIRLFLVRWIEIGSPLSFQFPARSTRETNRGKTMIAKSDFFPFIDSKWESLTIVSIPLSSWNDGFMFLETSSRTSISPLMTLVFLVTCSFTSNHRIR